MQAGAAAKEAARLKRERFELQLLFQIRAERLPDPQREFRFHPTRMWRFDFFWPHALVATEVEGSIHTQGRHTRGTGYEADLAKYNEAALLHIRVFRFSTGQVESGVAIQFLKRVFTEK